MTLIDARHLNLAQVAHAERAAWEAAHLGPDGDYLKLANGKVVKTSEYDADKHGPREPKPAGPAELLAAIWIDGFLDALEAVAFPAERRGHLLYEKAPEAVKREIEAQGRRERAQALVDSEIEAGVLVRLAKGGLVEASEYDPGEHGPKDCGHTEICDHLTAVGS